MLVLTRSVADNITVKTMETFMTLEKENDNTHHCPKCGHSDANDIRRKEATQERIRIMRRVIRKLCNGDSKRIAKKMDEAL